MQLYIVTSVTIAEILKYFLQSALDTNLLIIILFYLWKVLERGLNKKNNRNDWYSTGCFTGII